MADNTQGAPTEGLGQTVTFAFQPGGSLPQMSPGQATRATAQVRGGPAGGRTTAQVGPAPQGNPTLDVLMQLGEGIIRPKLEQAKLARYVDGMQQAATGMAMADVVENQPWYSRIFGDSDVVEGARAYHSEALVNDKLLQMHNELPELRKLTPGEARQYFLSTVQGSLTGDKATDAAVLGSMTRQLPNFMKLQAKEHYAYKQEQASEAEGAAYSTHTDALQAAAQSVLKGTMRPEEFDLLKGTFAQAVMPVAGRDLEGWQKDMTQRIVGSTLQGNLHAVNALREAGVMGALTEAQINQIERAQDAAETRLRSQAPVAYQNEWAEIVARSKYLPIYGGRTAEETTLALQDMNRRYMQETGSTTPLITASAAVGLISNPLEAALAERKALAAAALADRKSAVTEEAKLEAQRRQVLTGVAALRMEGVLPPGYSRDDEQQVWTTLRTQPGQTPEGYLQTVAKANALDPSNKDDYLVQRIEGAARSAIASEDPDRIAEALTFYRELSKTSVAAAAAYAGEFAPQFRELESLVGDAGPGSPELIRGFQRAFVEPKHRAPFRGTQAERQEIEELVQDTAAGFLTRTFAGLSGNELPQEALLTESSRAYLTETIMGDVQSLIAANYTKAQAVQIAIQRQQERGLELVGKYAYRRPQGSVKLSEWLDQQTDSTPLGMTALEQQAAIQRTVQERLDALQVPSGVHHEVYRLEDLEGVPQFALFIADPDRGLLPVTFTGDAIRQAAVEAARPVPIIPTGPENAAEQAWQRSRAGEPLIRY